MPGPDEKGESHLRGATRLAFDATLGVAGLVEQLHRTIQLAPFPVGAVSEDVTVGLTGLVYRAVRGGIRITGAGVDSILGGLDGHLPEAEASPLRQAVVSAANGVYGDHLVRTGNPLAIEMGLRSNGRAVAVEDPARSLGDAGAGPPGRKLLLLVHGLCMNDLQWTRDGFDHGRALADELGYTPLYLRYNSGLAIAENGRRLAELLERLVDRWPTPLEQVTILGHSMGGLVARAACVVGTENGHGWMRRLRDLVFLGTPHLGSHVARGGLGLAYLMDLSPYLAPFAPLGTRLSEGLRDLDHGTITADGRGLVPLPTGVRCHTVAATLGARRGFLADRLVGDGLVPLDSALGRHSDPARTLAFPDDHRWIGYETSHLDLLCRPEVHARVRDWLERAA